MAINIFDFKDLFVNQLAGDITIFLFLMLLLLGIAAARFRLPTVATMAIFAVSLLILSAEFKILLPIILFVVGVFYAIVGLSRMMSRG